MRTRIVIAGIACCIAVAGCSQKQEAPSPPPPGSAAPAKEAAGSASGKRPKMFAQVMGAAGEDLGRPIVRYANWTDKAIASFDVRVYIYDRAGMQPAAPHRVTHKPVRPIRPGEIREIETDLGAVPRGATVELVVPRIVFVDETTWADDSLAPEQRPRGG